MKSNKDKDSWKTKDKNFITISCNNGTKQIDIFPLNGILVLGKEDPIYGSLTAAMLKKNFSLVVCDSRFPALSEDVLNEMHYLGADTALRFFAIDPDDPEHSDRCNPVEPAAIADEYDAHDLADLILENIGMDPSGWTDNGLGAAASAYLAAIIRFLAMYDPDGRNRGSLCSFPHIIELVRQDCGKVFNILQGTRGLEMLTSRTAAAIGGSGESTEQLALLQQAVAPVKKQLGRYASPALYWVMTGSDLSLADYDPSNPKARLTGRDVAIDIDGPVDPSVVCLNGHASCRPALALYLTRAMRRKKSPSWSHVGFLLDEIPPLRMNMYTFFTTAYHKKNAFIIGARDYDQLTGWYGRAFADLLLRTTGNLLINGPVSGKTYDVLAGLGSVIQPERTAAGKISGFFTTDEPVSRLNGNQVIEYFQGSVDVDSTKAEKKRQSWKTLPCASGYTAEAVKKNFMKIKNDIKMMVEKEYERTVPFAERTKEEDGDVNPI